MVFLVIFKLPVAALLILLSVQAVETDLADLTVLEGLADSGAITSSLAASVTPLPDTDTDSNSNSNVTGTVPVDKEDVVTDPVAEDTTVAPTTSTTIIIKTTTTTTTTTTSAITTVASTSAPIACPSCNAKFYSLYEKLKNSIDQDVKANAETVDHCETKKSTFGSRTTVCSCMRFDVNRE